MSESVVLRRPFESATGTPCAMVLQAYGALSPVSGPVSHRRPRERLAELDPSVGESGPHAFAARAAAPRRARQRVHRIPLPTSVTIAIRPSMEAGRRGVMH